jgi:hypothetical protein
LLKLCRLTTAIHAFKCDEHLLRSLPEFSLRLGLREVLSIE